MILGNRADILFHEAYSYDPKTNPYDAKAPVTVPYMNAFHTSTEQLAGVLKKVNHKLTVIWHYVTFTPANATDQERAVSFDIVAPQRVLPAYCALPTL
jgi:ribonuclease BN (tRNA processing enzyme)